MNTEIANFLQANMFVHDSAATQNTNANTDRDVFACFLQIKAKKNAETKDIEKLKKC